MPLKDEKAMQVQGAMAKTAAEQLNADRKEKRVVLAKGFAGIKAGDTMFVATPRIVDAYIRTIPQGEERSIRRLRNDLARKWQADATCPVSTAIFLRIAAQAAIDEMRAGKPPGQVSPFWRVIRGEDRIAKKLTVDSAWIDTQRRLEGI